MSRPKIAPFGSWESPITASQIASTSIHLNVGALEGNSVIWLEGRPSEGGRIAIVQRTADGSINTLLPTPFNARSRVHEYGGGAMFVDHGIIYFSNFTDQRLYRLRAGEPPTPITPVANWRYADGVVDHRRERILCVREEHAEDGRVINTIVAIAINGKAAQDVLVYGNDFYAAPRISPDGHKLTWITWQHPNMPWDGTELWLADIQGDGTLKDTRKIAGGDREAICQPEWSPNGELYFISDRTGWWNLYRWREESAQVVVEMDAEFGIPQWTFSKPTYAMLSAEQIVCSYTQQGIWYLGLIDTRTDSLVPIETPYTDISEVVASGNQVLFRGGNPTQPSSIVLLDLNTRQFEELQRASSVVIDEGYLSRPQSIQFPTTNDQSAYALYYPPANKDYQAPGGNTPPLLVMSHGGPTGVSSSTLNLQVQYWTSRGFAVLDVNYRGSTGYGRAYREQLYGQWGVADIDDCCYGAAYLVKQGKVDGERLAIRGKSAGGYTTLCALTFRTMFKAGASYYGIGDLTALAQETHKFESRYLDHLIGPYPARRDLYLARSPVYHIEGLNCPVIFFQGLEDKVVPPNQADMMAKALRDKGIPVAHVTFEGEQHGFRRAENIERALNAELSFYGQIFGFQLSESIEALHIQNL